MFGLGSSYSRLWTASTISNLGDGVTIAAVPLLAASLTRDPLLVSVVTFTQFVPWLLFALVAGALVDRWDRRTVMWRVDLFRAGIIGLLGLTVATDTANVAIVCVAVFLLGTAETLFDNASQAILPSLVDRERLEKANGRLFAGEVVTNQFAGPPLGGLLFAVAAATPFLVDAGSFLAASVLAALIPGTFRPARAPTPETERTRIRTDIAEGLGWLWRHRLLRTVALMLGATNLVSMAGMAVFVLYAQEELGLGATGYGILLAASASGAFIGGGVVDRLTARVGSGSALIGCLAVLGMSGLTLAATSSPWVAGVGLAAEGLAVIVWNVITVSLRQSIIPDEILGRVNSAYRFVGWGAIPLGALLGGAVAGAFGVRAPLLLSGVANLLLGVVVAPLVNNRTIRAARQAAGAGSSGSPSPADGEVVASTGPESPP
jgi:MFS family permease